MGHGANDPHTRNSSTSSSQTCVITTQTLSHPTASVKHQDSKNKMSQPREKLQMFAYHPEESPPQKNWDTKSTSCFTPYPPQQLTTTTTSIHFTSVSMPAGQQPNSSNPAILTVFPGMAPTSRENSQRHAAERPFLFPVNTPGGSTSAVVSQNTGCCATVIPTPSVPASVHTNTLSPHQLPHPPNKGLIMSNITPTIPPRPGEPSGSPSSPTKSSSEFVMDKKPKVTSAITMSQHSSGSGVTTQKVTQWLMDNYESHEASSLPRLTLYTQYTEFCAEVSGEHVNAASFGKLIRSLFPDLKTRRLGTRGNSKYHYYGIRIKPSSYLNQVQHAALGLDDGSGSSEENISNSPPKPQRKRPHHTWSPVKIKEEHEKIIEINPPEQPPLKKQRSKTKKANSSKEVVESTVIEEIICPPSPPRAIVLSQQSVQRSSPPTPSSVHQIDKNMIDQAGPRPLNFPPSTGIEDPQRGTRDPQHGYSVEVDTITGRYDPSMYHSIIASNPPVVPTSEPGITASKFLVMYQTHTQRILECASRHCFSDIEKLLRHFWQGIFQAHHFLILLSSNDVIERIGEQDRFIYGVILNALFPNVLQPIPLEQSIACQTFAIDFGNWLSFALEGFPYALVSKKLPLAQRFSLTLSRISTLNHQSVLCRTFLANPEVINQMLTDWNTLDWHIISEQCGPVINAAYTILYSVREEMKQKLTHRCGLEYYSHWMGDMISARFWEDQKRLNTNQAYENVQEFLGRWSIFWTIILNELRAKLVPSYDSFQALSGFLQQYASYSVYNCYITASQKAAAVGKPFPFSADSTSFTHPISSYHQHHYQQQHHTTSSCNPPAAVSPPSSISPSCINTTTTAVGPQYWVGTAGNQQTGPPSAAPPLISPFGSFSYSMIGDAVEDYQSFEFAVSSGGSSFDSSFLNLCTSASDSSRKNSLASTTTTTTSTNTSAAGTSNTPTPPTAATKSA